MLSRLRLPAVVCAALVLTLVCTAFAAAASPLPNGSRVVFLGDSITQQMDYTRYVTDYFALRYPELKITFRNAGWSGDTAPGGLRRLQRDVLDLKPTVVTICFGMNDGGYAAFDQERYDRYLGAMTGLVQTLKKAGVRVVLLTPGVVDPDMGNPTYNPTLLRYAQGVKELAAQEKVAVSDINALMADVQLKAKQADPKFTMIPDSVHPSNPGHAVMAYGLLKALGASDPASRVRLDVAQKRAVADRAVVENLKVTPEAVTFTRVDRSFPAYFDPDAAVVFPYAPIVQELDGYLFQVTGLQPGTWKLTVQDMAVGTFSADALAQGVDLGARPGPWQKLGAEVDRSVANQEHLYFVLWRGVRLGVDAPKEAVAEKQALERKVEQLLLREEQTRPSLVTPRPWKWSLTRVK